MNPVKNKTAKCDINGALLSLDKLTLSHGTKRVIDSLSLQIVEGERIAILGRSGAGKSTLLHHIYTQLRLRAAFCAQSQGMVEGLSAFHNVFMGALPRHRWIYNLINLIRPFSRPLQEVKALLQQLELDINPAQKVECLSGGQRQRIALARALYQCKNVFIGDEAFSAVDQNMAKRLLHNIFATHKTVVMVLHDQELALMHFDRIVFLSDGRLLLDSPTADVSLDQLSRLYSNNAVQAIKQNA